MDVRITLFVVVFSFVIASCSNDTKYTQATESFQKAKCTGSAAIKTRAIIEWEDGHFSTEEVSDVESFKENFIRPQIHLIKFAQYDQKISLNRDSFSLQSMSALETPTAGPTPNQFDWGLEMIQADVLQKTGAQGKNILVGVVDTYVDYTHNQLQDQIAVNTNEIPNNAVDDDKNGFVDDYYYQSFFSKNDPDAKNVDHGTHVSGIIAANPDRGLIRGVAPGAKIVPAPFISQESGTLSDAIAALEYVSSRGVKIINASWGGVSGCDGALASEFEKLSKKGILLVVAAGNEGQDLDLKASYPASFSVSTQITVAASTEKDMMAFFSNTGFNSVSIAAPGTNIYSTVPGNAVASLSGTSMSTPYVSGSAALLWEAFPQASAQEIKTALLNTVDVTPGHEFKTATQGRLNVYKAYQYLKKLFASRP